MGLLVPGSGFAAVTAGLNHSWQDGLNAFVEGRAGWRPRENVDLFGFARADLDGAQAGVGAEVRF